MRYILDTHTLIWYSAGKKELPDKVKSIIDSLENELQVSIASLWEMAIKSSIGKLTF